MFLHRSCIFLAFSNLILAKSLPQNETSVLTTYAKVANFGSSSSTVNEGRSSGMSLYTQSSHAKIISGQNLKSRTPYYVPKPSRMSPVLREHFPAKGEVQERFNPRPYLDYLHVQPKKHHTYSDSSKPSPVYAAPFDSFPAFKGSDSSAGTSTSITYSPPMRMNGENENGGGENSESSMMDSYQPTKDDNTSPMGSSGEYPGYPYAPPDDASSQEQMMPSNENASSEETPDTASHENDHDYSHYHDVGPKIVNTQVNNGEMDDNGGGMNNGGDMSNEGGGMDMSAMDTPKEMPNGYPKLPEYLDHDPKEHGYHYPDFYHYDHHPVYHEITTTTTTTEAPEERVNNNYSYYYLGRKLWYIPLYFSSRRQGRNLRLEEMAKNVTNSIEKAQAKYMM
ncbi:hypothetical protein Trydic_g3621 [Trypoxylus dichotomus]